MELMDLELSSPMADVRMKLDEVFLSHVDLEVNTKP